VKQISGNTFTSDTEVFTSLRLIKDRFWELKPVLRLTHSGAIPRLVALTLSELWKAKAITHNKTWPYDID
jgi:hypothetical protein